MAELPPTLLIVGASARAAAFSALRAGLRPWCADLFADVDLQRACPALRIAGRGYPHGLERMLGLAPPGPWLYTGAPADLFTGIHRWRAVCHRVRGRWPARRAARHNAPTHRRAMPARATVPLWRQRRAVDYEHGHGKGVRAIGRGADGGIWPARTV